MTNKDHSDYYKVCDHKSCSLLPSWVIEKIYSLCIILPVWPSFKEPFRILHREDYEWVCFFWVHIQRDNSFWRYFLPWFCWGRYRTWFLYMKIPVMGHPEKHTKAKSQFHLSTNVVIIERLVKPISISE